jgi:hypothetical protein
MVWRWPFQSQRRGTKGGGWKLMVRPGLQECHGVEGAGGFVLVAEVDVDVAFGG